MKNDKNTDKWCPNYARFNAVSGENIFAFFSNLAKLCISLAKYFVVYVNLQTM